MSNILPVIIATAGHVDHGKTALVQALTGCNTDRLLQEKERGLSIDIGFAPCVLSRNESVGIVDLPGHEDYIKNMAAGAASADVLLLVIAANESVMPQTREHLEIVSQLTDTRVIVVITKIDLVEAEYLEIVKSDAVELVREYGMEVDGIVCTSTITLVGIDELRREIARVAAESVSEVDGRDFRLFVERTFLSKGHGIVVTGIPVSGLIRVGDKLYINNDPVRVRGLECYGKKTQEAASGGCVAINLDFATGVADESIKRGDVLVAESYSLQNEYIVRINNISRDYNYKRVTKCRIHTGTLSCNASLKIFGEGELEYGGHCNAHLIIEKPAVLIAGDRFLLRAASPYGNIAGGVVLSEEGGYRLSARDRYRGLFLEAAAAAVSGGDTLLAELLAGNRVVVSREQLLRLGHLPAEELQKEISRLVDSDQLRMVCRDYWLAGLKAESAALEFGRSLEQYHLKNKYRLGMEFDYVAELFGIPVAGVERLLKLFSQHLDITVKNNIVACRDYKPELTGSALVMYQLVLRSVNDEPQLWLALGEVREQCGVTAKESQEVVRILVAQDAVVLLGGKYLLSSKELARLAAAIDRAFEEVDILDISYWRKVSGLGRNHAVAVLEYFDSIKMTLRVETGRKKVDNCN